MTGKANQARQLSCSLAICILCVAVSGCDSRRTYSASKTDAAKSMAANVNQAPANAAPTAKIKFRLYNAVDQQLGGMTANRIAIPEDWKATSRLEWNIDHLYLPTHMHIRAEAPDGGSWVDIFGMEMFCWLDRAHDQGQWGVRDRLGSIHHPNVSLPEAMVRYVIVPNRRNARNLRVLGYRPVNNLPKAFSHMFPNGAPRGEGICMRVQYELDGSPVDEEFYGFMPPKETVRYPPASMEYHSYLYLTHSLGAKAGKLESMRSLLGFIATSLEVNPAWQQRHTQIRQAGLRRESQNQAQQMAGIKRAGQIGAQVHASNEAFLKRTDASLAQSRAQQNAARSSYSDGSSEEFAKRADSFDQYVRGTEHMQDQNGNVSDQYTDYNYHWADGFGKFVHTDDPNLDPNKFLNGNYQQMTPPRK